MRKSQNYKKREPKGSSYFGGIKLTEIIWECETMLEATAVRDMMKDNGYELVIQCTREGFKVLKVVRFRVVN